MTSITLSPTADLAGARAEAATECGTRGCSCRAGTSLTTLPNVLTIARTISCAALVVVAVETASWAILIAAVAVYWVGDVGDGILARVTRRETPFGAALDILCDRACCTLVLLGAVSLEPSFVLPVAVYLLAFVVVDTLLSLTFLAWPLLGVNYLRLVNRRVWLANFSPPAKVLNSAVFLVLLGTGRPWAATVVAAISLGLKSFSLVRMLEILLARPPACFTVEEAAGP